MHPDAPPASGASTAVPVPHSADANWASEATGTAANAVWASEAPSKKASRTGPLIAFDNLRRPVWTPRDYASLAREGFMQNAIVYRCVRMISECAATVPLLLYEGDIEIEQHPILDLVRRPNPLEAGPDLFETFFGHLLVSGNAYLEAVSVDGTPRELHALRPDRMKVVPGPDGWPEAHDYTVASRTVRIRGEAAPGVRAIFHMRLYHPLNDHYGMSPMEAAATAIDLHNASAQWNKALLDNAARPSGALVYTARDGNLTTEQYERLKSELEQGFQGAANAGRPMLLEGGLDWKSMSLSPKDMDFIEARHVAAREIALAFGVPPMLLGIPGDNTYSNMAEATRSFWRGSVLPLVTRTAKAISTWLGPAFGGNLALVPDIDSLPALAPERESLWASLEKTSFLTLNEKRVIAGFPELGGANELKFAGLDPKANLNPGQLRVPAAQPNGGQWGGDGSDAPQPEQAGRGRGTPGTPAQQSRLAGATTSALSFVRQTRELDPTWQPPQSLTSTIEGEIAHQEAVARAAQARYAELTRDAIPGFNPSWGVNRLTRELHERGFRLERSTDSPRLEYQNPQTGERVRIMERPTRRWDNDPPQKHYFENYYRYRESMNVPYRSHIPIPDRD